MVSCKEDGGAQYSLDVAVDLSVVDENGTDLLDPDNPTAYAEDDIRIFYLVGGEKQEIYKPNLDNPRMFFIYKNEESGRNIMRLFPNYEPGEENPITYVQWSENDTDTLQCQVARGGATAIPTLPKCG